jgi:hypothetical protein
VLQSVQRSNSQCSVSQMNQSSFVLLAGKTRILLDLQDVKRLILYHREPEEVFYPSPFSKR